MEDNCVVLAETEQASQMKILFEILKDILVDAPIEFIKDMSKININDKEDEENEEKEEKDEKKMIQMVVFELFQLIKRRY
jgi:hypothetical protein